MSIGAAIGTVGDCRPGISYNSTMVLFDYVSAAAGRYNLRTAGIDNSVACNAAGRNIQVPAVADSSGIARAA